MKHPGIIAIVFVIGCATGGVAAQLVVPPVRAGTAPTRWEYQCATVGVDGGMTSGLNKLGAQGWELVSVAPAHTDHEPVSTNVAVDAYTLCAKRALP
ncbi:MAG TPA: hypothetical protein VHW23_29595 [Kofleriaceae bacterium]|jgi:hypothetical protein|nr:hypothetical protein [Kofleriaceae bacterium]